MPHMETQWWWLIKLKWSKAWTITTFFSQFLQKAAVEIQELKSGMFQVPCNLNDTHLVKQEEIRVQ